MKRIIGLAFTAALAVSATALPAAVSAADVKFGALYPFSGGLALLGDESFRGLEIATEERNAAGGVKGNRIVLVKGDGVDANAAVGEARRLTSVENVKAIFGTYSSSLSIAASQVAELAGVPYFELGAVSDPITERGFQYIFRTNPTAKSFAQITVSAIPEVVAPKLGADAKALKVAIIHEDSLYGQTVSGFQKERAKELGLTVVEVLPYAANTVDMSSLIQRLKGAAVDVVLQTAYQNDAVLFFRQSKEAGYKPKAVIGAGGGYSLKDTARAVGAETIEGALNVDFTQYKTNPQAAVGLDKFVEAYRKKYGTEPRSGHSLANYFGANVFFDAMEKAKSLDGDAIRASVLATEKPPFQSATGWGVKFDAKGQNVAAKPFLMQWQGGELVTVYPENVAVAPVKLGSGG